VSTGAARIEIHKGGLNDFIRTAAATRGFKSDVDWYEYSAAPINIHRNLGTLRVHEGGELFELGGELAEAVTVFVPVHVRLESAGGGGSTDEIVQTTLMDLAAPVGARWPARVHHLL
ncbi:hypothetical protein E4U22_003454, partial [Claviceps purpurea]